MEKGPNAISRQKMCEAFVHQVFDEVYFQDMKLKKLMQNCYLDNIESMMAYAMENNIRLRAYFFQIKQELLKVKHTHERKR